MNERDAIIIGGGTVGAAIGYGLARRGLKVSVFDGGDTDFRAARANFGLVWAQGKGRGLPAYQHLTRQSTDLWPGFLDELRDHAGGMRVDYERNGGLNFCLGEAGYARRAEELARLDSERLQGDPQSGTTDTEMLDRRQLEGLMPKVRLGDGVSGASYCWRDGHVNPLQLLAALHVALTRLGGDLRTGHKVQTIRPLARGFAVETPQGCWHAPRVVIAAGIASGQLGAQVGITLPIRSQRGQILVTQRLAPLLPLPCSGLRQTAEGTVMIGATQEDVGEDTAVTGGASGWLARKTITIAPDLETARVVRHWSGLRILTPDGYPVYAQSETCPGAFVATCHSGVTLAAIHAHAVAGFMADGALSPSLAPFHQRRFDVQATR